MGPVDFAIIGIVAVIVVAVAVYIVKAKKSGKKCIGCPDGCCSTPSKKGSTCSGGCSCCCGCSSQTEPQNEDR